MNCGDAVALLLFFFLHICSSVCVLLVTAGTTAAWSTERSRLAIHQSVACLLQV